MPTSPIIVPPWIIFNSQPLCLFPPHPHKKIHFLASIVNENFPTGQKKIPHIVITILEHHMLFFVNVMH